MPSDSDFKLFLASFSEKQKLFFKHFWNFLTNISATRNQTRSKNSSNHSAQLTSSIWYTKTTTETKVTKKEEISKASIEDTASSNTEKLKLRNMCFWTVPNSSFKIRRSDSISARWLKIWSEVKSRIGSVAGSAWKIQRLIRVWSLIRTRTSISR